MDRNEIKVGMEVVCPESHNGHEYWVNDRFADRFAKMVVGKKLVVSYIDESDGACLCESVPYGQFEGGGVWLHADFLEPWEQKEEEEGC